MVPTPAVPATLTHDVVAQPQVDEALPAASAHVVSAPAVSEPVASEPVVSAPAADAALPTAVAAAAVAAAQPQPTPAPEAPVAAPSTGRAGRVTRRAAVRRTVSVQAAQDAASHLSEVLGVNVPLALLVARAAARSGQLSVAVAALSGDELTPLAVNLGGDFREGAHALAQAQPGQDAQLLVLDGSALAEGELLLTDSGATLTVTPGQDGATLTLIGLDAGQADQVLGAVERELQTPIKLLF